MPPLSVLGEGGHTGLFFSIRSAIGSNGDMPGSPLWVQIAEPFRLGPNFFNFAGTEKLRFTGLYSLVRHIEASGGLSPLTGPALQRQAWPVCSYPCSKLVSLWLVVCSGPGNVGYNSQPSTLNGDKLAFLGRHLQEALAQHVCKRLAAAPVDCRYD